MHYLLLIYFNSMPLHISGRLAAHHQEDQLSINSNWYSHALCWLVADYTKCCLYRVELPDDEQQACSKHVEAYNWNKLIENSTSCWFEKIVWKIQNGNTAPVPKFHPAFGLLALNNKPLEPSKRDLVRKISWYDNTVRMKYRATVRLHPTNWAYTEFVLKKYPIWEIQSVPSVLQSTQKYRRRKAKRVVLVVHTRKLYYASPWIFYHLCFLPCTGDIT